MPSSAMATAKARPTITTTARSPRPLRPRERADSFQIDRLRASGNVHLVSPGKVMTGRNLLEAKFVTPIPTLDTGSDSGAGTRLAGNRRRGSCQGRGRQAGTGRSERGGREAGPAKDKPAEPGVSVSADRVWAVILLKPDTGPKPAGGSSEESPMSGGEVQTVLLRGGVVFHQDPEAGKTQGTDVTGEALDVTNQGDGKLKFVVQNAIDLTKLSATEKAMAPHARVATEEMTITGPSIGLDQATDHAWVEGAGTLTQMASRGLLTDKGLGEEPADDAEGAIAGPGAKKQGAKRMKTRTSVRCVSPGSRA